MPRFFSGEAPFENSINLYGDDARHIGRSLRMRLGDVITVCYDKVDYSCRILKISDEVINLEVIDESPSLEPDIDLVLYQAVPKLDKLELIVQKATELGAVRIVPVMTARCVSRPDSKQFAKKRERLERIAFEAAKQSGRGIIPEVMDIITLDECIDQMKELDLGLICYEKGGKPLNSFDYPKGGKIGVLIGSEGGFDEKEAKMCADAGISPVWLGARILRCETAPISAISIIMNLTGNM